MGLKHLKAGVEKKFAIPLRSRACAPSAEDGLIRYFGVNCAKILDRGTNASNRELVRRRVVHDAALADLVPSCLELWLDQDDSLEHDRLDDDRFKRAPRLLLHRAEHRGQYQRGGDKRHIHGYKTDARAQSARFEVARIGTLAQ